MISFLIIAEITYCSMLMGVHCIKLPRISRMWLDVELGSLKCLCCLGMPTDIVGGWVLYVQLLTVAYGRHRWVGLIVVDS